MEQTFLTIGDDHACRASWREYQKARDALKRADRDLGETVAFLAASLTTVTAIQAVTTIALDKLGLPQAMLLFAFKIYLAIFLLVLLLGLLRAIRAMVRRARAERNIDQTKKGVVQYCPIDQWAKLAE